MTLQEVTPDAYGWPTKPCGYCGETVILLRDASPDNPAYCDQSCRGSAYEMRHGRRMPTQRQPEPRLGCPTPNKRAWGTREVADVVLRTMRDNHTTDDTATLAVYECRCGYYHLGRSKYRLEG